MDKELGLSRDHAPDTCAASQEGLLVSREIAVVFRGGGRRWFTEAAAIRAVAKAIIRNAFDECGEAVTEMDFLEYQKWVSHLAAKIKRGNAAFNIEDPMDAEGVPPLNARDQQVEGEGSREAFQDGIQDSSGSAET